MTEEDYWTPEKSASLVRGLENDAKSHAAKMAVTYTTGDKTSNYLTRDGKPLLVFENICRVLENDSAFQGSLRLNDFSSMVEVCDKKTREWILLSDGFILYAMRHVSVTYPWFVGVKKEMLTDAIRAVASQTKVNPPKEH